MNNAERKEQWRRNQEAAEYIRYNFDDESMAINFVDLSITNLWKIIRSDVLRVKSEQFLFERLLFYIDYRRAVRLRYAYSVSGVRFVLPFNYDITHNYI